MVTYKFFIEGDIQIFKDYDDQTIKDFQWELQQYMANKLDDFRSEKVSASGKIASLRFTE
ncbi:MAG: hypothetical protein WA395_16170 [Nitrososphaeraceae archaeon]|jgi:hypothetical protein